MATMNTAHRPAFIVLDLMKILYRCFFICPLFLVVLASETVSHNALANQTLQSFGWTVRIANEYQVRVLFFPHICVEIEKLLFSEDCWTVSPVIGQCLKLSDITNLHSK